MLSILKFFAESKLSTSGQMLWQPLILRYNETKVALAE